MVNEVPLIGILEKIHNVFFDICPIVKRLDREHMSFEKRIVELESRQRNFITQTGLGFEVGHFKKELFEDVKK